MVIYHKKDDKQLQLHITCKNYLNKKFGDTIGLQQGCYSSLVLLFFKLRVVKESGLKKKSLFLMRIVHQSCLYSHYHAWSLCNKMESFGCCFTVALNG